VRGAVNLKLYNDLHTTAGIAKARVLQKEFMPLQDAKNAPPAHQRRIGHAVELTPHFAYGCKGILSHQTENPGVQIGG